MTCPRCHGLVVDNYGEPYCLNCGHRTVDVGREAVTEEVVRDGKRYVLTRFVKRKGA